MLAVSFKCDGEIQVSVNVSNMLEFQEEQNQIHLHKLCMANIQFPRKLYLKCGYFKCVLCQMVCAKNDARSNED